MLYEENLGKHKRGTHLQHTKSSKIVSRFCTNSFVPRVFATTTINEEVKSFSLIYIITFLLISEMKMKTVRGRLLRIIF